MDFLLRQSHGHSFQEVEGLEAYYSTELVCDCALDKLFPSRGWISYSAPELGDQIVELNRCICMGRQTVSVLCKVLLFHHKWFLDDTWTTEGAARPLKGREHRSYESETQPNTRCRPSHLSRTIHSSHREIWVFRGVCIVKEEKFVLGNIIVIKTFHEKVTYISKGCHTFSKIPKAPENLLWSRPRPLLDLKVNFSRHTTATSPYSPQVTAAVVDTRRRRILRSLNSRERDVWGHWAIMLSGDVTSEMW